MGANILIRIFVVVGLLIMFIGQNDPCCDRTTKEDIEKCCNDSYKTTILPNTFCYDRLCRGTPQSDKCPKEGEQVLGADTCSHGGAVPANCKEEVSGCTTQEDCNFKCCSCAYRGKTIDKRSYCYQKVCSVSVYKTIYPKPDGCYSKQSYSDCSKASEAAELCSPPNNSVEKVCGQSVTCKDETNLIEITYNFTSCQLSEGKCVPKTSPPAALNKCEYALSVAMKCSGSVERVGQYCQAKGRCTVRGTTQEIEYDFSNCVYCDGKGGGGKICVAKDEQPAKCKPELPQCKLEEVLMELKGAPLTSVRKCSICGKYMHNIGCEDSNPSTCPYKSGEGLICCLKDRKVENCAICDEWQDPETGLNCKCSSEEKLFGPDKDGKLKIKCCKKEEIVVAVKGKEAKCSTCEKSPFIMALNDKGRFSQNNSNFKKYMGFGNYEEFLKDGVPQCNKIEEKVKNLCNELIRVVKNAVRGVGCRVTEEPTVQQCVDEGAQINSKCKSNWFSVERGCTADVEGILNSFCDKYKEPIEQLSTKYSKDNCEKCKSEIERKCKGIIDSKISQKAAEFKPDNITDAITKSFKLDTIKVEEIDLEKKFECIEECLEDKPAACKTGGGQGGPGLPDIPIISSAAPAPAKVEELPGGPPAGAQ